MPSKPLNRSALRSGRVPWPTHAPPARPAPGAGDRDTDGAEPHDLAGLPLSRRRLLGLAAGSAAGAVGTPTAVRAIAAILPDPLEIRHSPGRLFFLVGGRERWQIDASRFAGSPRLDVTRGDDEVVFRLIGARFPGTPVDASLDGRVWRAPDGWRLRLAMPQHRFDFDLPFIPWLESNDTTRDTVSHATVRLTASHWQVAGSYDIALGGAAIATTATLTPDWRFRLAGDGVARLTGPDADVIADTVEIHLPLPGAPSVLSSPSPSRTLIALARGRRPWRIRPDFDLPPGARFDWRDEPFDRVYVESSEEALSGVRHALVAEGAIDTVAARTSSPDPIPLAAFDPGPGTFDRAGVPFRLPLSRIRYAIGTDGPQDRVFMAWLGDAEPWLVTTAGTALKLGDPDDRPAVEIAVGADGRSIVDIAPALRSFHAALGGVVTQTRLPADARTAFVWEWSGASGRSGRSIPSALVNRRESRLDSSSTVDPVICRIVFTPDGADAITQARGLSLALMRPDDFMVLGLAFDNLILRPGANPGDPQRLVAADARQPMRIVVHFPPQHITERASLDEGQPVLVAPTPPIPAALASPSRLAFTVPAASFPDGVPYTLDGILDWSKFTPVAGPVGAIRRPTASETALVVPYRLILQPEVDDEPAWAHARAPVTHDGRTELWHTRLGREGADGSREVAGEDEVDERNPARLRAVWTESFDPNAPLFLGCNHPLVGDPFAPMSLTPSDRQFITMLTGTGDDRITNRRLFLSALGAWLDVTFNRSAGNNNCQTSLESWTHKAAMGRDFFVRLVYRGTLLPFGHRAVLIKVTERKFERNAAEDTVAALWQRQFLVVREPEKAFNNRKLPFRRVRIVTESTPSLRLTSPKAKLGTLAADGNGGFWPVILVDGADRDFPFQVVATDWDGRAVELTMAMAWIAEGADVAVARTAYNAETGDRVKRPMAGQKVAYAPSGGGGGGSSSAGGSTAAGRARSAVDSNGHASSPGDGGGGADGGADTALETQALTFAMDAAGITPIMRRAGVIVEPLKNLIGDRTSVDIAFDDTYLAHGFDGAQNVAEIFAKLESKLPIDFGGGGKGDRGGGLVTPNFDVAGLSRKLGLAAGDLASLAGGTFDPADFLDVGALGAKAKILGFSILDKILALVPPAEFGDGSKVPKVVTRVDVPAQLSITEIDWSPKVIQFVPFKFNQGGTSAFTIHAVLRARLGAGAGGAAEFDVVCELTFFAIDLVAIKLTFDSLKFAAGSGKATSLVPEIAGVAFGGPLKFIEKLKEVMSSDVLGVGPKIDVTPTGILAGISVGLPSIAVGVFSLENIRLSAALNLPLTGDPVRFRFAFCERQSPFVLTVSAFGGGGYVAVHLGADGLAKLEMALEFGAQLSMSIGIASGSVGIMAGIYLELTKNGDTTDILLTGYLRCWGELDILGLISISAEFYLAFTYDSARNSCRGQAKLTVKIEILFFEKTFTLSVEREFKANKGGGFLAAADRARLNGAASDGPDRALAGPGEGIAFADLYAPADWAAYCGAFA